MSIPNPPTDNLYKFAAIFGLIVIISITAIYATTMPKIIQRQTDLEVERQIIINDNVLLYEEYKYFESKIKIKNDFQAHYDFNKKTHDIKIKNVELWKVNNLITANDRSFDIYSTYFILSIFVGMLSISCGFYYWYKNLQIHKDMLIKYEALQAKSLFEGNLKDITPNSEKDTDAL